MTQIRKDPLENGEYYHIFSRSIAKFIVFNNTKEYLRIVDLLCLHQFANFKYKYSKYSDLDKEFQNSIFTSLVSSNNKLVEIAAYCIMPTHFHLILKQITDGGISKYVSRVLNSYTRYFNLIHRRTGPLWSGRFKSVLVSENDQLLHLTRYIHLNPTSAELTKKPDDWQYSSYNEYIDKQSGRNICVFENVIDLKQKQYEKFVVDRQKYQLELSKIKQLLIDDYTG